jgi:hypothetical protein
VLLVLIGHLLACGLVIWLMPGGWPWVSAEFFAYRLLPIGVGTAVLLSLSSRNWVSEAFVLELLRTLWMAVAFCCLITRSRSLSKLSLAALLVGLVLTIAVRAVPWKQNWARRLALIVFALPSAWLAVHLLRAPVPSTHPVGASVPQPAVLENVRANVPIGKNARLDTTQGSVTLSMGRRFVQIEPLLTFVQRSPDATWTVLASRRDRMSPTRNYLGIERALDAVTAVYRDGDESSPLAESTLKVSEVDANSLNIESTTFLPTPVYSHLNTFTQITIAGHRRLSVAFSPIPGQQFEVTHAGYPFGQPARFAYVDAGGRFHVVEARSGEKGPFKELGAGPADVPLTLTFFDGDEPLFEMEMKDFVAQASTEPSPAAGWGVPQNAIEFGLLSDDPKSPASVFITLAATSVGRGWSSVGHNAGAYRNRLEIRLHTREP